MRYLLPVLLASTPLAHAADNVETAIAPPLVVTATRVPSAPDSLLQPATLYTRTSIDAAASPDVFGLLNSAPGFEAAQNGGLGSVGAVFLRGTDSDQTLVLVDGIRLNAATNGAAPINHLLLNAFQRAELVRGNMSSLYGSQAIGGVLQFFTQSESDKNSVGVQGGAGSLGTRSGGFHANFGTASTRAQISATYLDSDGFSAVRSREIPLPFLTRNEDLDDDAYRNTSFTAALSHTWREGQQLRVSALHTQARTEFDGEFENRANQRLSVLALSSINELAQNWVSRLTLGETRDVATSFLDTVDTSRFDARNQQITWQNEIALSSQQTLLAGFEWLRQTIDATTAYDAERRSVRSPFFGYTLRVGNFSTEASVRHDDYSDVEDANSGRLAVGYDVSPQLRLHAAVASAFKAPTFNDLYFPGFGNADLRPERARSAEIGLRFTNEQARFEAIVFNNRLRDLIVFDGALSKPINVERARNDGLELSYRRSFGNFLLSMSGTWQDPRDRDTDKPLVRRAKWFGSVALRAPVQRGEVQLQVRTSGARSDRSFDFTQDVRLGGYTVADLTAQYPVAKHTRLTLRAENLFDKDYELAAGYNTTPRRFLVELLHEFY